MAEHDASMPCRTRSRHEGVGRPHALAIVTTAGIAAFACGCKRSEATSETRPSLATTQAPAQRAPDAIPHTTMSIKIDGEWDEGDWAARAWRGRFRGDDGDAARPVSEARLLHDGTSLLVALYAADVNIETADAFDLTVGTLALHIDSTGKITPPSPGIRVAVDMDEGTRDNPKDDDEEWVVEAAIPLTSVGLRPGVHVPIRASRCDTQRDGVKRCGALSTNLMLE